MATQALSTAERGQEASESARSNQELREVNRHMREFVGLLGHELRSPLAAIRNALHLLEQQGDDAATPEDPRQQRLTRDWDSGRPAFPANDFGRFQRCI